MKTKIKADTRERESGVSEILIRHFGIDVETEQLKTGDYIISDQIAVERKSAADFCRSIIDGRLFMQAARMKRAFDLPVMIIEGEMNGKNAGFMNPHAIDGALISLIIGWQVPVLYSRNNMKTAYLIRMLAEQSGVGRRESIARPGYRPKTIRRRQKYIIQGLPGVGSMLSEILLNRFGSVERVMCATEEELKTTEGLGEVKARRIREILTCGL